MERKAAFVTIAHKSSGARGPTTVNQTTELKIPIKVMESLNAIVESIDNLAQEIRVISEVNREDGLHVSGEVIEALKAIKLSPSITVPEIKLPDVPITFSSDPKISVKFETPKWLFPVMVASPAVTGFVVLLIMKLL
jgi:hypothetical protein